MEVKGLRELELALAELPKATARNTLVRAGKEALKPFLEDVKAMAPVDEPGQTPERPPGTYRDSWIISTRLNRNQARFARREGKSFAEVYAGTNDPLGVPLEFGTVERVQSATGRETGRITAKPHGRPAWDGAHSQVLSDLGGILFGEIQKSAERLARKRAKGG